MHDLANCLLPRRSTLALVVAACQILGGWGCAHRSVALVNITDRGHQWVWPYFIDNQPTALVFWNTNEMECWRNIPGLQGLDARGTSVQLVSVVTGRDRLEISNWLREKRITYPVLLDLESKLADQLGVTTFPTFILYGVDGKELDRETDIRLVKTWFENDDKYRRAEDIRPAFAEDLD